MTHTEIITLVKAGYVVVTPEGQSQQNLLKLTRVFLDIIPYIAQNHIQEGEAMSMEKMVENLKQFNMPNYEATSILSSLKANFLSQKANNLARELEEVLRTKQFSESRMPELDIRIKIDNTIWNKNN